MKVGIADTLRAAAVSWHSSTSTLTINQSSKIVLLFNSSANKTVKQLINQPTGVYISLTPLLSFDYHFQLLNFFKTFLLGEKI